MKLYSYVVAYDYGFAPNPFYGVCTLATCKPRIRSGAQIGDWVLGTGSARYGLRGRLVYVMRVEEAIPYEAYWTDSRFWNKRPNRRGSFKQAYGDNIYHRHARTGRWIQEWSHHSLPDGRPNRVNLKHDTQSSRVLIGSDFTYWGADGPHIPRNLRSFEGADICAQRGHRVNFPEGLPETLLAWIATLGQKGCVGRPREFLFAGPR